MTGEPARGAVPPGGPGRVPHRGPEHWDEVYGRLDAERVSWHQAEPTTSLALIERAGVAPGEAVVDVGGGMSPLAGALVARGLEVTVLDHSAAALRGARRRLGAAAGGVRWVRADVRAWVPDRAYALWHDRAMLHFLVRRPDRSAYAAVLRSAVRPGGHAVIATFAADGPERCSGLPVVRFDPEELVAALGPGLTLVEARREEHVTPGGVTQPFTWVLVRVG